MRLRRSILVIFAAAALTSCAGSHIKPAAVCSGKHRRPANLYGTILPTLPVPLPPSQSGGQSADAPVGGGEVPGAATPAPQPGTAPPPNTGGSDDPGSGPANAGPKMPKLSKRDIALSYSAC